MNYSIPRALTGPGKRIFEEIHQPLLRSSMNFDRVSSYFGPRGLAKAITEITKIWNRGGKIRMILSPEDTSEIYQALENITNDNDERKRTTIEESIEIAIRKIKGSNPEIVKALEEMLINGLLQVAIVIPRFGGGLFHSKFSIYHIDNDSEIGNDIDSTISKYVAVHGSFNESEAGYGRNIEDASTHRSWDPSEYEVAHIFKLRFDELWNDFSSDVISIPINDAIKKALNITNNNNLGLNDSMNNLTVKKYLDSISTIPSSLGYNNSIWLMPHQIAVVNSVMKYKPVRSMLCDEVGLGKTIQAGAVMSRLIAEKNCEKILIIAPAATLTQWAIEISEKFGHHVSIYRNQLRERFLDGKLFDETRININKNPDKLKERGNITIISSQWFRLRTKSYVEKLASNYQMIILDEAHHARLENWEKRKGTELYKKIKIISELIPNILLLSATPFQTGKKDYYSLLNILQNITIQDEEDLRIGSGVVSGELPWNKNQQSELIRSIERRLKKLQPHIPSDLFETIKNSSKPLSLRKLSDIIDEYDINEELLYSTLPTTLSTIRNTRSMLKETGMGFPEVIFNTISVIPNEYEQILRKSETFIMKYLGGKEYSSGLTRSLYHQRAVSSIAALYSTLNNRLDNIMFNEIEKAEFDLDFEKIPPASAIEMERIETLLGEIEEIRDIVPDPKLKELVKLTEKLYQEQRKILIFSRYTDTTNIIENKLWIRFPNLSIGRYDGEHIRIRKPGKNAPLDVTKDILVRLLRDDEIDIIVCSDAASEGLNLQSASAVINIDIPWNPARVLQRIGRVDRLGQLSSTVVIYNLVYFGTIEQRMYRVLDDRQTDCIRLLGESPEILATEETRHLYQVFGNQITKRLDSEQSDKREGVMLARLLEGSKHLDLMLMPWLKNIINQNLELGLSLNPASKSFVMRNEDVLASKLNLNTNFNGEIGYAVCKKDVRHALLMKTEQGFLPLTPSVILDLDNQNEVNLYQLEEAVEIYTNHFSATPEHRRTPGLMAEKFAEKSESNKYYKFKKY